MHFFCIWNTAQAIVYILPPLLSSNSEAILPPSRFFQTWHNKNKERSLKNMLKGVKFWMEMPPSQKWQQNLCLLSPPPHFVILAACFQVFVIYNLVFDVLYSQGLVFSIKWAMLNSSPFSSCNWKVHCVPKQHVTNDKIYNYSTKILMNRPLRRFSL